MEKELTSEKETDARSHVCTRCGFVAWSKEPVGVPRGWFFRLEHLPIDDARGEFIPRLRCPACVDAAPSVGVRF
jgi:hypothetical protein